MKPPESLVQTRRLGYRASMVSWLPRGNGSGTAHWYLCLGLGRLCAKGRDMQTGEDKAR